MVRLILYQVAFCSLIVFLFMASRRNWTAREDEVLRRVAQQHQSKDWSAIARRLYSQYGFRKRTGKQCRERWFNHLDPSISKKGWTNEDEELLLKLQGKHGNKWTCIAALMPGRSDNSIKNYFYSTVRRYLRRMGKLLGTKNSTGFMRDIKPSTLARIFSSVDQQGNPDLYDQLQREGLTRDFLRGSCERIREAVIKFSSYKPKKNDKLDEDDREKFNQVFWLLEKVNSIYERVRGEQKSQRSDKQLFRNYYNDMNRQSSQGEGEGQISDEAEQLPQQSQQPIQIDKSAALELDRDNLPEVREMRSSITVNIITVQRPQDNLIANQSSQCWQQQEKQEKPCGESTQARGVQGLQDIVQFAQEIQFNDPEFQIQLEENRGGQMNNLEIQMSNMSFKSILSNSTPISQVNFFKSPRSGKIMCLNDYLMRLSNSSYGKDENELVGSGLQKSGNVQKSLQ